ncbi:DoxX family membrane protein [Sphingobacterium olei]|uniref:DoxX family membrane protein n=1 Tax=Sphingobacterium olei TaxID=2571155 RepID=A0A4U0P796_9SPHI|nr:DoxX family membrane protein [Sphingobacterium olei]TJZ63345.1 DoxX family membrane protein [Sphingobacterium olei]
MTTRKTSKIQHAARILLGSFMVFAGAAHLSFSRFEFQAQVPNWVPLEKDLVVILSGVIELAFGFAVIILGHKKKWVPWLLALFFVAVFPGNWAQYINQVDAFGLDTDQARLGRLFFQPVLIVWALWSMGAISTRGFNPESI